MYKMDTTLCPPLPPKQNPQMALVWIAGLSASILLLYTSDLIAGLEITQVIPWESAVGQGARSELRLTSCWVVSVSSQGMCLWLSLNF